MRGLLKHCTLWAWSLGMAFQIVDDALDYRSELAEMGKNSGDDFNGRQNHHACDLCL